MTTRINRTAVVLGAAAFLAGACSGDDPETVVPSASVADTIERDEVASTTTIPPVAIPASTGTGTVGDLTPDVVSAEELDTVTFSGLADDADSSELELLMYADGAEPISLPLYLDESGLHAVMALHPSTPGEGGSVTLQFVDGDDVSEPIAFELYGLPAAPGAFGKAVDLLTAELSERASAAGTSLEVLLAEASSGGFHQDPELSVLQMIAGLIDDGSDTDLSSLPVSDGLDDEALSLLDSIIGKIDPTAMIPGELLVGPIGFRGVPRSPAMVPSPRQAGQDCMVFPLEIGNGDQLAAALATGVGAQRAGGGAVEKLTKDVAALAGNSGAANDAATVAGASDLGNVISPVAKAAGVVDTMYSTMDLWFAADAGRYPSSLTSLEAGMSTTEFNEDYREVGKVERVSVVAASTGFDGAAALSKISSSALNAIAGSLTGKLKAGVVKGHLDEMAVFAGEKLRDTVTGELIKELNEKSVSWCPDTWTVDITDSHWVKLTPHAGLKVDEIPMTYEPTQIGDSFLRIEARSDRFSGQSPSALATIVTKRLQVIAAPEKVTVKKAGDQVDVTAELRNADTTTLDWRPEEGSWNDGRFNETNDGGTRPLLTPTNPDSYPFLVTVESTSETGLRKDATDVRNDIVEVRLQDIIIEPDPGRVPVKKQIGFAATDREGNPVEVRWAATGGSIADDSGLYTAFEQPGTYTVTATSLDDPSRSATATVIVFDTECLTGQWRLRSQEFLDQIGAASGAPGQVTYRSGEYLLTMNDDGTYVGSRAKWSFAISASGGTLVTEITSTDPGTWSADETTLSAVDQGGNAQVKLFIDAGGGLQPLPAGSVSTQTPSASVSGPYTCEGDVLTVASDGISSAWDRVG